MKLLRAISIEKYLAFSFASLLFLLGCLIVTSVLKLNVPWAGVLVMSAAFGVIVAAGW